MSKLGEFFLIQPSNWRCKSHGDVVAAARRAEEWYIKNGTYNGAEEVIEEFVR